MKLSELEAKGAAFTFADEEPLSLSKVQGKTPQKKMSVLDKVFATSDKIGKVADTTFGSFGKVAGNVILGGADAAAQLIEGGKIPEAEKKGYSATSSNPETKPSLVDTAFAALETYPGGGFLGKALRKLPGGEAVANVFSSIPEALKAKAVKQYSEALGATKEEFKTLTKKVVPELLDRGVKARNLTSLAEKAATKADSAGQAVGIIESTIPETAISQTQPIFDALSALKNQNKVGGKIVNKEAVKAIEGVEKTIQQFGDSVSQKSLIGIRRILDKTVAGAKGFTKDEIANLGIEAKKEAADAIRSVISVDLPDLAAANKEFTFWKRVQDIAEETNKRKSTQTGIIQKLAPSISGGLVGFSTGDDNQAKITGAIIGAAAGKKLLEVFASPGYKMLSANTKNRFANILASGDKKRIEFAIAKLVAALKNTVVEE